MLPRDFQMSPKMVPLKIKSTNKTLKMTSKADKEKQTHAPSDRPKSNRCFLIDIVEKAAYYRRSPGHRHKQHAKAERHGGGMRSNWIKKRPHTNPAQRAAGIVTAGFVSPVPVFTEGPPVFCNILPLGFGAPILLLLIILLPLQMNKQ